MKSVYILRYCILSYWEEDYRVDRKKALSLCVRLVFPLRGVLEIGISHTEEAVFAGSEIISVYGFDA